MSYMNTADILFHELIKSCNGIANAIAKKSGVCFNCGKIHLGIPQDTLVSVPVNHDCPCCSGNHVYSATYLWSLYE